MPPLYTEDGARIPIRPDSCMYSRKHKFYLATEKHPSNETDALDLS